MTERELKSLKYLTAEIKELEADIRELERGYYHSPVPSYTYSDGINPKDPTSIIAIELTEKKRRLEEAYSKRKHITDQIDSIKNNEIKTIIKMRYINNRTWEYIGEVLHMDRRTVSRKFFKFLKNAHNARSDCDII